VQKQSDIGRREFFGDRSSNPAARAGDQISFHWDSKRRTSNAQRPTSNSEGGVMLGRWIGRSVGRCQL